MFKDCLHKLQKQTWKARKVRKSDKKSVIFSFAVIHILYFCVLSTVVWVFISPNSSLEILASMVMVLEGGAFERRLDHKDGVLWMGLVSLKKRAQRPHLPSTHWGYSKKIVSWNKKVGPYQTPTLWVLWFWSSSLQNCEKKISDVYKQPDLWYYITAAWMDLDTLTCREDSRIF
jgi:hypothetical protein